MCQIFLVPSGEMPDKDKFAASVLNNPDGWGMAEATGAELQYTYPSFADEKEYKGNVDAAWEALGGSREHTRLMHLRYTTAGSTTIDNAHPFVLTDSNWGHPLDVCMAHNGTISKYRPSSTSKDPRSDTCVLVEEMMGPLFDAVIGAYPKTCPWDYEWVQHMVDTVAGFNDRLCFLNHKGEHFIYNEDSGAWLDNGVWVANEYSFNRQHRVNKQVIKEGVSPVKKPTVITPNTPITNTGQKKNSTTGTLKDSSTSGTSGIPLKSKIQLYDADQTTPRFSAKFDCSEKDLMFLDEDCILTIIDESPDDACLLIQELQVSAASQAIQLTRALSEKIKLENKLSEMQKTLQDSVKTNVVPMSQPQKKEAV